MDGDQVTVKAAFSIESNDELDKHIKSKSHYIGVDGINVKISEKEAVQSIYSLTRVLPYSKLTEPKFKKNKS